MEDKDKIIIQKNYIDLVQKTDLYRILPLLISKGVFSERTVEPYQDHNKTVLNRKRDLFANIHRRGPHAFKKLIESLQQIGDKDHIYLANKLLGIEQPTITITQNNNENNHCYHIINNQENVIDEEVDNNFKIPSGSHPFKLSENQRPAHIRQLSEESPYANINLSDEPLKVVVRKSEQFFDNQKHSKVPVYPMRGKPRGLYLGINNMEFINNIRTYREGAQVDEKNLKELFSQMEFECHNYRDQTNLDMRTTIKNFTKVETNPNLKRADCLVVAIMSHGEEGDSQEHSQVITSDGQRLSVSWILEQFNNFNCPDFQSKPKIFLFQICRGDTPRYGVPIQRRIRADGLNVTPGIVREMTDMLIAWSTLPGDRSYRDTLQGTWYMQLICEVFMKHAYDTDVEGMLKIVDEKLKNLKSEDGNMQTSSYESRAFKLCYLHPGLYE